MDNVLISHLVTASLVLGGLTVLVLLWCWHHMTGHAPSDPAEEEAETISLPSFEEGERTDSLKEAPLSDPKQSTNA